MTCYQQYNLLGEKIFPQAVAGDSYIEIMQIFLNRLQEQQKAVAEFREKSAMFLFSSRLSVFHSLR